MKAKAPFRIAILEAGYPPERAAAKYEFPGLEVTKWDVQKLEQYPSLDDIDAVLISGSASSASDNTPWTIKLVEFTRMILIDQTRVRIIGICFGHQIVARALGAKVDRNAQGWEASVVPMRLSPLGKGLFSGRDTLNLYQMHRDIVTELPEGVQLLGSTPVCENHGMYAPKRLITVQGHPEFNRDIVSEILGLRKSLGIISQDMFEEMMSRVDNKHDGLEAGVAVLKFLDE